MQNVKNIGEYKDHIHEALDNEFQRSAIDKFAQAYPVGRAKAFDGMDVRELVAEIAAAKDEAISRMGELYEQFKREAEKAGIHVHLAKNAGEANEMIANIAKKTGCKKIVKSKSMTAEETLLNHHLEGEGLEVTETDLGEWIIQMRHEGPSHMVMPAIHLSRDQVAGLFSQVTGKDQTNDIEKLVKVARRELRQKFVEADMGISGANFAIAESASIGLVTNEGNARLVTTLPRVHVALCGLDKLVPTLHDALRVLRALPRNATGQIMTSYGTWIHGPNEDNAAPGGKKEMHIVFLDNGRTALAEDPDFRQVLRCIRCGACANVCPVYRMVGGHEYGHIYIGAIGLILTYFFHGRDKAKHLVLNCINCQACKAVCAAGIDLPSLIKRVYARIVDETGHDLDSTLLSMVMRNRKLFHGLLRAGRFAQKPFGVKKGEKQKGQFIRHLPMMFSKQHAFRELPAVADKPFRDIFPKIQPKVENPRYTVAIFGGCAQDFLYPEQLEGMVNAFADKGVAVDFPMQQTCCGLPLMMMGERKTEKEVASQNIHAIDPAKYDYIVCSCPSCASHLKHYPEIFGSGDSDGLLADRFADKIIDISSFLNDVLEMTEDDFETGGPKATYHAPCHLCRGLDVHDAPREIMTKSGLEYVPCKEEEVCCGFGGSYSVKFPEISQQILRNKLDNIEATGAEMIITDCPGCVMQIRGGMAKRGSNVVVRHMTEVLAERRKK
ncbi:L-lactate dehydrogenase (quinone) large subunit LdhH [Oceanidesulfovibrio marinus]|uniref:4Fe-4S dicluster domain-containing protein n=1 Tax=Oceanidesulfovibrio marinus TaxID=370038 RepID=A0ABX6NFS2_9BACT|nr:LUD domain-containing protein [Oceanidesulfovibrio marinus]QJT09433.1 4Fe-4S dicluster domain-containing protein [Oceanidesulfovibrio marinus]